MPLAWARKRFKAGALRVPALDADVMPLISAARGDTKTVIALLDSWLAAWDKENFAQPVDLR